jgi:hypothetical protein
MATEVSLNDLKIPGKDAAWNFDFGDAITLFGVVHESRQTFSDHMYRDKSPQAGACKIKILTYYFVGLFGEKFNLIKQVRV